MATTVEETTSEGGPRKSSAPDSNQYLTFTLGEECYGVDILRVQEIKGYTAVTRIPNTPPYIKGVLNLRGTIVPIVDLRAKFGMAEVEPTMFTVIVVLVVRDRVMGIIVDTVSDVLDVATKDMQPPPNFGPQVDTGFIKQMARAGDKLITLLDIDRALSTEDLASTATMSYKQTPAAQEIRQA